MPRKRVKAAYQPVNEERKELEDLNCIEEVISFWDWNVLTKVPLGLLSSIGCKTEKLFGSELMSHVYYRGCRIQSIVEEQLYILLKYEMLD